MINMYILIGFSYCIGRLLISYFLNDFNKVDLIVCSNIIWYSLLLELFYKNEK